MKYHLHENNWTIIAEDVDFVNPTQEQADLIAKLVAQYQLVIFNNVPSLTNEQEVKFCLSVGKPEEPDQSTAWGRASTIGDDQYSRFIQRVTGEKNKEGNPGLFGHKETLDWHVDFPWKLGRKPLIWLRAIRNAKGSRTSWINTRLAYEDLLKEDPAFIQELIDKNYRVVTGWRKGDGHTTMYDYWHERGELDDEINATETAMPIVFTNELGHTGFYIPFLQSFNLLGEDDITSKRILSRIWNYCLQEKYMFHLDWADTGMAAISDQWLSVHKRWEFEGAEQRYMHRIPLDYTNTSHWSRVGDEFKRKIYSILRQNIRFNHTSRNILTKKITNEHQ